MNESSPAEVPRYAPDRPLPPYTYVPGRAPHPTGDSRGHNFGVHATAPPIDEATWSSHATYLYAIDLFNLGYYWEAHEVWEAVWHAVGRSGPIADLLKGLIKLAAAGVKAREGRKAGVVSHARRAAELLESVTPSDGRRRLGLVLEELAEAARGLIASPPTFDASPEIVQPVLPIRLAPGAG